MTSEKRLELALLALRIGIIIVFTAWTLDKIFAYEHNSGMIGHYYGGITISQPVLLAIGIAELVLLFVFFFTNYYKTITYGIILIAHTVTTIVSFKRLLPPYEIHQLLYFGSLPLLAACIALFLLRDDDTLFKFGG